MKYTILFLFLCAVFVTNLLCGCDRSGDSLTRIKRNLHSSNDVVMWAKNNLRYQNDDPWDEAPDLGIVIKNGYGDCKMLAGVVAVLLTHVNAVNWIVTIKKDDQYHMFNVYVDSDSSLRVISNARLVPTPFANWTDIENYFDVNSFINSHSSYEKFRSWFNHDIFPQQQ